MSKFDEQAFEALNGPADKLARVALIMRNALEKIEELTLKVELGADISYLTWELASSVLEQVDWVFEEDK